MRTATINRKTKETDIQLSLCLEGGEISIDTGVGFLTICLQHSLHTRVMVLQ